MGNKQVRILCVNLRTHENFPFCNGTARTPQEETKGGPLLGSEATSLTCAAASRGVDLFLLGQPA
jgi:hypothetical protein